MKNVKTIINESKSGKVVAENDSYMTDIDFGEIENCVPGNGDSLKQFMKRRPNAQIFEMNVIEISDETKEIVYENN